MSRGDCAVCVSDQLKPHGLVISDVRGDGNCMFRSVADQLEGNQHNYASYREKCCDFMAENPENFQPFVFDQDYNAYIRSMRKDGE